MTLLRVYGPEELGLEGYPPEWHGCPECEGHGYIPLWSEEHDECGDCEGAGSIKALVRREAGRRCERCRHPYRVGEHGNGEWTPCDRDCDHAGPLRVLDYETRAAREQRQIIRAGELVAALDDAHLAAGMAEMLVEARWRILTVHHLTGDKADCRWWNLAALCQRCHLEIQGRVRMARPYALQHSDWFRPHAAGWYAWRYLGEELDRDETLGRLDELLALELQGEQLPLSLEAT